MIKALSALGCVVLSAAVLLPGCTPFTVAEGGGAAAYHFLHEDDVNLLQRNYAAADYLDQQMRGVVARHALIRAVPLTNSDVPSLDADMAFFIPEDIGERFIQLGYKVDLAQVTTIRDTRNPAPAQYTQDQADYILSGAYRQVGKEVEISLRVTSAQSGKRIASFDYVVATTRSMRSASKPAPKIVRVP